jgi:hypothetical protein
VWVSRVAETLVRPFLEDEDDDEYEDDYGTGHEKEQELTKNRTEPQVVLRYLDNAASL